MTSSAPRRSFFQWLQEEYLYALTPEERLSEIMFGLIMVMGVTGSVHLATRNVARDSLILFWSGLGCNLAWGLVDAVMYVVTSVMEKNRRVRLMKLIREAKTEEEACQIIGHRLDSLLEEVTTLEERYRFYSLIKPFLLRRKNRFHGVERDDLVGAAVTFVLMMVATLPVLFPFVFIWQDPMLAVRISHGVAACLLFSLGFAWAHYLQSSRLMTGLFFVLLGVIMTMITIALGG